MIEIKLKGLGKRFQYDWIFKNLNYNISSGSTSAITGSNGSGKSTLLKCISGINPFTEGQIEYNLNGKEIPASDIFKYLVISAPYLELPEELSLTELLKFHFKFKDPIHDLDFGGMMRKMYLEEHRNKSIYQFSSGMKQRLKLGLCLFSDVPLVLLDEPTSNLDEKGSNWYLEMIGEFGKNKTILICSNDSKEYNFCKHHIHLEDYKLIQKL
ncbi:ABC transporter ATP-binding protein [Shivajiella indica]|uniref:ATP-binding cassette domain-containing protein n=1 Tax=Shivajiella indica TaxID=872115 RepID=A0ABW5BFU7_9BACT